MQGSIKRWVLSFSVFKAGSHLRTRINYFTPSENHPLCLHYISGNEAFENDMKFTGTDTRTSAPKQNLKT